MHEPGPGLAEDALRGLLNLLLADARARDEFDVLGLDHRPAALVRALPPVDQRREPDGEVGGDEGGGVKLEVLRVGVDENGEPVEEQDEEQHHQGVAGEVRLERSAVAEGRTVDSLNLESLVIAKVGERDSAPGKQFARRGSSWRAQELRQRASGVRRGRRPPLASASPVRLLILHPWRERDGPSRNVVLFVGRLQNVVWSSITHAAAAYSTRVTSTSLSPGIISSSLSNVTFVETRSNQNRPSAMALVRAALVTPQRRPCDDEPPAPRSARLVGTDLLLPLGGAQRPV